MDYLDTKKEKRHSIILFAGYICIAVAIVLTAIILLYQAYGFGVTRKGDVTQNGLVFFSSQPNPANISINGALSRFTTNTRMAVLSGVYKFELSREGYHTWQRMVEVEGGAVQHFDYPFLIPNELTDQKIKEYTSAPAFSTQSPDRRWLVVQQPSSSNSFQIFDLKNPTKEPVQTTLPANILTNATTHNFEIVSWASDNNHFLLKHNFDGKSEHILTSRTAVSESRNLNTTLSVNPSKLTLLDKKYDKYYVLNDGVLQRTSLSDPALVTVKENVLAYQSYGDDMVLYATDVGAPTDKIMVRLAVGENDVYDIRALPKSPDYLLDLTKYSDKLYVAAAANNQQKTYIYEDPIGQISKTPKQLPAPIQVLRVNEPNYLSFSNSAQFVMVQKGDHYGVYDVENERGYNYVATEPLDAPATHATWMDGNRLTYVSGGRTLIFDYDHNNPQFLLPASSSYLPAFSPDYKFVYTFRSGVAPQMDLMQVSLRSKADQ